MKKISIIFFAIFIFISLTFTTASDNKPVYWTGGKVEAIQIGQPGNWENCNEVVEMQVIQQMLYQQSLIKVTDTGE